MLMAPRRGRHTHELPAGVPAQGPRPCACRNYVHAGQAACRYSWMTPPRRSSRCTARRSIWSGSRGCGRIRRGAAAASDRWVRCRL